MRAAARTDSGLLLLPADFLDRPLLIPNNSRSGSVRRSGRSMHVDLTEDAKAFHVKADLPGVKKDDIKVGALDAAALGEGSCCIPADAAALLTQSAQHS